VVVTDFESVGRIGVDSLDLLVGCLPHELSQLTLSSIDVASAMLGSPCFESRVTLGELNGLRKGKESGGRNKAFHKFGL
jgi:hypothetical protein